MLLQRVLRRGAALTPVDPSYGALIGDLNGPVGRISPTGSVLMEGHSWSLEWGVRDGERWRRAHTERAVRQNRLDDTPVYETRLRVAGGDVIQRVGVLNDGSCRALFVEYENDSPAAVLVATVGRIDQPLTASADGVSLDDGLWMRPERPAGAVVIGRDIWDAVAADAAEPTASGAGAVAVLLALPHRQTVGITVGIDGEPPTRGATPAEIAAGWRAITSRGLEVAVPDAELDAAWRRIVCDLVLAASGDQPVAAAEAAWWLDLAGLRGEADRGRARVLAACDRGSIGPAGAVAALRALASGTLTSGTLTSGTLRGDNADTLAEVAGPLARLSGSQLDRATLGIVARALQPTAPSAAADARRLVERVASKTYMTQSPVSQGAERVLGLLFADTDDDSTICILPTVPTSWNGQSLDVRGMVTGLGSLSFSVRWHGERPALLWERIGGPDVVELRCPGFAPEWSSTDRSGEALLAF